MNLILIYLINLIPFLLGAMFPFKVALLIFTIYVMLIYTGFLLQSLDTLKKKKETKYEGNFTR